MTLEKRRIVMKVFIKSHFNYYTLMWMFHLQAINIKSTTYMKES